MEDMWDEMRKMQRQIDGLMHGFGETFSRRKSLFSDTGLPDYRDALTEVRERGDTYVLEIELPGIEKEDIKLNIQEHSLEIKAEKKREKKDEDKEKGSYKYAKRYSGFYRQKRYSGFYRQIQLPENADTEKVEAVFKNGVLTITVPRKPEGDGSVKHIDIK